MGVGVACGERGEQGIVDGALQRLFVELRPVGLGDALPRPFDDVPFVLGEGDVRDRPPDPATEEKP